jgi:hypothetical protein
VEKVIYAVWRRDGETREVFNARLLNETGPKLLALPGVRGLRLNLQDEAVTRAEPLRQTGTDPQMDAAVQLWLDVSHGEFRAPVDAVLRAATGRIAAWVVLESSVIPNTLHPSEDGKRTEGWSQFCFIQRPQSTPYDQWLHNWQGLHTSVAIDTQSNFEYLQNRVITPLIEGPHPYVAIVEECFPTDAMDDSAVFFDAVGDAAKYEANTRAMAESCARFVEMGETCGIDVLPTSQYELRKPR